MKFIILFMLILFTVSCAIKITFIKLKTNNFENYVDIYTSGDSKKKQSTLAFIVLHGKVKGRHCPGRVDVAVELSNGGYTVYAPEMPYNNYLGILQASFKHIDQLVKLA